jgi:serine/threonine protein kinase
VKVTPEGKVLDFGLAKAFAGDAANDDPSNSPTLSAAATMQGTILGTAAYMSPEQARGKACDKRTDIWAFGCVLYELLTGRQAFQGESTTEILAAVLREEPDWQVLPAATPVKIRDLLRRCLQKDVNRRARDAGDGHGREDCHAHRVHCLRRCGHRAHFFVHVPRQLLDVAFVEIPCHRVTLTVDFHFHAV